MNRVLDSSYTAEGPETERLLQDVTDLIGRDRALAASSGTASLHLLLEALGIGPGDEVLLPSYTCQSLLHPIHHVGAKPVTADVEADTLSVSARTIRPHLTGDTALVVLVHNFGYPVDDEEIFELDVPVVEDLATALGARKPKGPHVGGNGIACFGSFYATKQLAAGLGGFVASDDPELIDRIRDLKTYDEREEFRPAYNYSFSDLNAALARSQFSKLADHQKHRGKIADLYDEELDSLRELTLPHRPAGHALYRYVIRHPRATRLAEWIRTEERIEVKRPVHEPLHRLTGESNRNVTDSLHDEAVMLPLHPAMSLEDAREVVRAVKSWATRTPEPSGS